MTTLRVSEQTNRRVLPQPAALETVPADTAGVATKRGTVDRRNASTTGVQHGRGETSTGAPARVGVTPDQVTGSGAGTGDRPPLVGRVFVLDRHGRPLQPTHPARARELLRKGRARVHRHTPFVIRLVDVDATNPDVTVDGVELGIDPGSKTTGMAVFVTNQSGARTAVSLIELVHRGLVIKNAMTARAQLRRGRRTRNLRYRAPRFNNRTRKPLPGMGVWLAPSIAHRVITTLSWLRRLARWAPITVVWVESVRFDMQALENPEITGVQYRQGTLAGMEMREYLLEKYQHRCVYCGATGVPLNIDHIHPRSRGGSDRVSNLALACIPCNQAKGAQPVDVFLAHDPARLTRIKAGLRRSLRDAAAVNSTRKALVAALEADGFPVKTGTGGRTKFNRTTHHVPKTHTLDALCVGELAGVTSWPGTTLTVGCTGRGRYRRVSVDKYGFPRKGKDGQPAKVNRTKIHHGYQTGDFVRAVVPTGKKTGTHVGRVAVRSSGSFNITTKHGTVQGIHHRHVRLIQRGDGYSYQTTPTTTGDEK